MDSVWLDGRYTPVECKVETRRGRVFEECLPGRDARDGGFRCLRLWLAMGRRAIRSCSGSSTVATLTDGLSKDDEDASPLMCWLYAARIEASTHSAAESILLARVRAGMGGIGFDPIGSSAFPSHIPKISSADLPPYLCAVKRAARSCAKRSAEYP